MNSSSRPRPPTLNIFPSHPMHAATNSGQLLIIINDYFSLTSNIFRPRKN
ncbi:hypothetical protein LINPERPRIM_LOCUS33047 [Linum perenne]